MNKRARIDALDTEVSIAFRLTDKITIASQLPFGLLTDLDILKKAEKETAEVNVSIAFRLTDGFGHGLDSYSEKELEGLNCLSAY